MATESRYVLLLVAACWLLSSVVPLRLCGGSSVYVKLILLQRKNDRSRLSGSSTVRLSQFGCAAQRWSHMRPDRWAVPCVVPIIALVQSQYGASL